MAADRAPRTAAGACGEPATGTLLDRITTRKRLRVGYGRDNPPYSFFNAAGELVGFDVEMAHELAGELGVSLEFVPVPFDEVEQSVLGGCCDVVMSGDRGDRGARGTRHLHLPLSRGAPRLPGQRPRAFPLRDAGRAARGGAGAAWASRANPPRPRGCGNTRRKRRLIPMTDRASLERFLAGDSGEVDALVLPAERGGPWSLRHPQLAAVVPDPPIMTLPIAYVVGEGDERLRVFLNAWIDIEKRDGTIESLTDYWIYGRSAKLRQPRWNVLDNVFGWTK